MHWPLLLLFPLIFLPPASAKPLLIKSLHPSLWSHDEHDAPLLAAVSRAARKDAGDGAVLLTYGNLVAFEVFPTFVRLLSRVLLGNGQPYSRALVVSCLTTKSYEICRAVHVDPELCLDDSRYGFDDGPSGWLPGDRPAVYRAMGLRKVALLNAAVSSGCDAFVLDFDVGLLGDIFPVFREHGADIVVTQDNCKEFNHVQLDDNFISKKSLTGLQGGAQGQMINIGVLFVRSQPAGRSFVKSWTHSLRSAWQQYDDSQDPFRSPWDQAHFHLTLVKTLEQESPARVQILSSDVFPHGCLHGGCGCNAASNERSLRTCSALTVSKWVSNHASCVRPWDKTAYMEHAVHLKQGLTQFRHRSRTVCRPTWGRTADAASVPWVKYGGDPVLKAPRGAAFDLTIVKANRLDMWFSWRVERSLGFSSSADGLEWSAPEVALRPRQDVAWEAEEINRPFVLLLDGKYWLWYTGQSFSRGKSHIGLATSTDGKTWTHASRQPVLEPTEPWELGNVMCPHVIWEPSRGKFRMWYSGGEMYEPNAIGYAESADGSNWRKEAANPVFKAHGDNAHEAHKVTAAQVIKLDSVYVMYYVCFENEHLARVCVATSPDGLSNWSRGERPLVEPTPGAWDGDAVYKPFAVPMGDSTYLYYNGRRGNVESIGLAIRNSTNLC